MKVGITGHQQIPEPEWVRREIFGLLHQFGSQLIGVTCLAVGADQIFAMEVLNCGGMLQVIVPFAAYSGVFDHRGRRSYEELLSKASLVEVLPDEDEQEQAFFSAGKRVADLADVLIAVWNERPAEGLGGTADVVQYAKTIGLPCININPLTKVVGYLEWKDKSNE